MTLLEDESSCKSSWGRGRGRSLLGSTPSAYGEAEGEDAFFLGEAEKPEPAITPVYNGRELEISPDFLCCALSGISVKHYNGSCLPPAEEEAPGDEYLLGEDYFFDDVASAREDGGEEAPPDERSPTMSSLMKLCYVPKKRVGSCAPEDVPEAEPYEAEKPPCVQDGINYRNSFWDLHRPELCKLTWPYEYVAEATVTSHLHKHLLSHGPICAGFHDHGDFLALLNKELDVYDALKELQPPRAIPPDEKPYEASGGRRRPARAHPCKPRVVAASPSVDLNDESDLLPYQSVHGSKEEFCITIGRPVRRPPLRESDVFRGEPEQLWLPTEGGEYEDYQGYPYGPVMWTGSSYSACEGEESVEEDAAEPETEPAGPVGWVEPDFCAMV